MSKPVYTLEDVKKHNSNKDCWIVVKNKVYDVTKFLEQHPGGEEVLLDVGGKNATQDFEDVGHSEEANKMMLDYYIGELAPSSGTSADAPKQKEAAKKPSSSSSTPTPKASSDSSVMTYVIPIGLLVISVVAYFAFGRGH